VNEQLFSVPELEPWALHVTYGLLFWNQRFN